MAYMFSLLVFLLTFAAAAGECANGCNGHGRCTSYDMCICNRNWQANDCSERICQFGLAHVDTPKGDLDVSGAITGPNHPVIDNSFAYPYGTTEQFPQMEDSDLNVLDNSAHYYMECSNKGTCDRATGECNCFDGYEGVACQRASCPGSPICSGHGVCMSAKQLAAAENKNTYALWDKDMTMGCKCDAGYSGPSCADKTCKVGVDPLYLDDSATVKYATYDFATLTTAPGAAATEVSGKYHTDDGVLFNDGSAKGGRGHWAIKFFDAYGEDWVTSPIQAGASCSSVVAALEALPNSVVPHGTTFCTRSWNINAFDNDWSTTGGLGSSTGGTLYDAQHPSNSAHPYKISYRMSIWDAYAASAASEDVGEGGIDDPKVFYPSSFSRKSVASAIVGAAVTSAASAFTTKLGTYQVGMLLTKVSNSGVAATIGLASAVNPVTTGTTTTFSVTFVGSTAFLATDAVVGQTPTISGVAYQAAGATSVTTTTPGFVAGMTIVIGSSASVLAPKVLTSVTKSTTAGVTYYTLKYASSSPVSPAVGDRIAGFSSYTIGGTGYSVSGTPTVVTITGAVGFSDNMIFSANGATGPATNIAYKPAVTTTATWTTGSTTLTLSVDVSSSLVAGMSISASGINSGQYVISASGTSVVISANPDVAGTSKSITFGAATVVTIPAITSPLSYATAIQATTPTLSIPGSSSIEGPTTSDTDFNALIVPTSQDTTVSSQQDYCGFIKNSMYVAFTDTSKVNNARFRSFGISNGAYAKTGSSFTVKTSAASAATTKILYLASTAYVTVGMTVSGANIDSSSTVVSVIGSTVRLSLAILTTNSNAGVVNNVDITFTISATVPTTTLIVKEVYKGVVTSGLQTSLGGGVITCGTTGNLAIGPSTISGTSLIANTLVAAADPQSYPALCSMTTAKLLTADTYFGAGNDLVEFTGYITGSTGFVTITNVASGPVVSGLNIARLDNTATSAILTLSCFKPIPKGSSGVCTVYKSSTYMGAFSAYAGGSDIGSSSSPLTFVASTLFTATDFKASSLCLFFFSGAVSTMTAYSNAAKYVNFYPHIDGDWSGSSTRATLSGYIYRLKFYGNPGALRAPEIVTHLDGARNSLMSVNYLGMSVKNYRVITKVWTDGQQGESNDYFADHCDGVQVTISNGGVSVGAGGDLSASSYPDQNQNSWSSFILDSLTSTEKKLLMVCLGDSDFDVTNNVGVYNWDRGYDVTASAGDELRYPHLIKLVRSVTTYTDGGYYAALYYKEADNYDSSGSGGTFYLLNPFSPPDAFATDSYEVYTTKGVLAQTSSTVAAYFGFGSKTLYTVNKEDPYSTPDTEVMGVTKSGSSIITAVSSSVAVGKAISGQGLAANTIVKSVSGAGPSYTLTVSPPVVSGDGTSTVSLSVTSFYSSGDLSCEQGLSDTLKYKDWNVNTIKSSLATTLPSTNVCLNKSDIVTFLSPQAAMNPPHLNLYTIKRLHKSVPRHSDWARWGYSNGYALSTKYVNYYNGGKDMKFMTSTITLDQATNWAASVGADEFAARPLFYVYKFYPAAQSTYNYVAPCSNRGTCDTTTGQCKCFPGYTSDDCHEQSSLSM